MKRSFIIVMFLFSIVVLLAQNYDTVYQIDAEKSLAERIEKVIEPIAGKTVVIVDLELRYPPEGLVPFGMELDKKSSLPGIPVAKSKGVLTPNIADQPTFPTIVTKKKIIIYADQNLSPDREAYIAENVAKWFALNLLENDVLEIRKELDLANGSKGNFFTSPVFYFIIFLLLLIVFFVIALLNVNKMAESMRHVNITGIDSLIRILSSMQTKFEAMSNAVTGLDYSSKEPLPIQVMEKREAVYDESMDFHFIEKLSMKEFVHLIKDESADSAAFILANLSTKYAKEFFQEYLGNSAEIIKNMTSSVKKTKKEVQELRSKLYDRFKLIIEESQVRFEGASTLIKVTNSLPTGYSSDFYKLIQKADGKAASDIRAKVFLLEDVEKLDDNIIDQIIKESDHNLLVKFLLSVDESLLQKFFQNMSERNILIVKEDMEVLGPLSSDDKEKTKNSMLAMIRSMLKYK